LGNSKIKDPKKIAGDGYCKFWAKGVI